MLLVARMTVRASSRTPLIASTFDATSVPQLNGGTTLVVQAFDLGLLVPLGLFTAVTVQRGLVREASRLSQLPPGAFVLPEGHQSEAYG